MDLRKSLKFLFLSLMILITGILSAQQTINGSIIHDGIEREYILYIPANYSGAESVPLVMNFHGYGSNAYEQMFYGDFRPIADTAGFLVVHPQGTLHLGKQHWNVGGWTIGSTVDDVGFTGALIDSLSVEYNIDFTRVYATGMSNGGFMSFLLACQLGHRIAAIAPVAGSMTPETYNNCDPSHSTPVLQIHGTTDPVVSYSGSIFSKPVETALQYWVTYNQCVSVPIITQMPDVDPEDGSIVEYHLYEGGNNQVSVAHYQVIDGGHTWPGSVIQLPETNNDINASEKIWRFFSQYDLFGLMGAEKYPDAVIPKIYPNPVQTTLYVALETSQRPSFTIKSTLGNVVVKGVLTSGENAINVSSLPPAFYILEIETSVFKFLKIR